MVKIHIKSAFLALLGRRNPNIKMPFKALPFKVRQIPPGMRDPNNIAKLRSDLRRAKLGIRKCDVFLRDRVVQSDETKFNKVLAARAHFRQLEEHVKPILAAEDAIHG